MYKPIDREKYKYYNNDLEKLVMKYVMLFHILTLYGNHYYFGNTLATNWYGIFTQSHGYNYLYFIFYEKNTEF